MTKTKIKFNESLTLISLIRKPVEEISIGEVIIVKPGDKIPLDGKVAQGETSVNQAPITGESIPVVKHIGDMVYAGTINEHGSIEIVVTNGQIIDDVLENVLKKCNNKTASKRDCRDFEAVCLNLASPGRGFGHNLLTSSRHLVDNFYTSPQQVGVTLDDGDCCVLITHEVYAIIDSGTLVRLGKVQIGAL